jgi:hypothetical protein
MFCGMADALELGGWDAFETSDETDLHRAALRVCTLASTSRVRAFALTECTIVAFRWVCVGAFDRGSKEGIR